MSNHITSHHILSVKVRARVKARLGVDPYEMAKEDRRERYDMLLLQLLL
jgi:hypothetical protein